MRVSLTVSLSSNSVRLLHEYWWSMAALALRAAMIFMASPSLGIWAEPGCTLHQMSNAVVIIRIFFMFVLFIEFLWMFFFRKSAGLSSNSIARIFDGHADHDPCRGLLNGASIPRAGDDGAGDLGAVRHDDDGVGTHLGRRVAQLRFNLLHGDAVAGR